MARQRDVGSRIVPRLVLVGGAPASGKTTLAEQLAEELSLPLVTKDLLKEALFDSLGVPADRERSAELSRAAYTVLYRIASRLVRSGTSLILEANFHRGRSEVELLPLVQRSSAVMLLCETSLEELRRRYQARIRGAANRHPGHLDDTYQDALAEQLRDGLYEPLDLPIPTLRIDTTNGYQPEFDAIVRWIGERG